MWAEIVEYEKVMSGRVNDWKPYEGYSVRNMLTKLMEINDITWVIA